MSDTPIGIPPPQTPPDGPGMGTPHPGCQFPTADRYLSGARRWSLDLCQQARCVVTIRKPEHDPQGGEGSNGFRLGFAEIRTEHPVRAFVEPDRPACRIHHGRLVVGRHGMAQGWLASQPSTWNNDSDGGQSMRRNSPMYCYIKRQGTPGDTPTGFACFGVAFRAQFWSEAILNSERQYCGHKGQ